MAGIGFVLRRLAHRDDLLSTVLSYSYAFIISSGPWILTSLTMAGSLIMGSLFTSFEEQATFRIIIIYNFSFSLVFSGPILMVATRHLSDMIYRKEVDGTPGLLVGAMVILMAIQLLISVPFYLQTDLELLVQLQAIFCYLLVSGIWLVSIFLSAMKNYRAITGIFFIGLLLAMILAGLLATRYGLLGMLIGFNIGISTIFFIMLARVFAEYPFMVLRPFEFLRGFKPYWALAVSGLLHNLAGWVDKWIMWFSPQGERLPCGLISFPDYDSSMFLAYLTIIPAIAAFMVNTETRFFECYLRFFQAIQAHHAYADIEVKLHEMIDAITHSGRNLFIIQGAVTAAVVLAAPSLFTSMDLSYMQLSIFRIGGVGAFFHVMALFALIILSYFDLRKPVLWINALFFVSNALFTWIGMYMGFQFYGFGYFFSSMLIFAVSYLTLFHHLNRLPYYVFIKNNPSAT